ncbi:dienelactone hydrolase family protein [Urbifossiella limnaea]|uniref:Dienelactone hydrolase family protein n=1 Tax=Urbifossiella limnaea TaxID=2528023 RepID=A0A517Y0Z1_9BACT|nr:dienelactone hydrolase family protein [Urbifossiella limnaea]QDU23432.1 Dienelactone hydrolase family protein [Urbifossiella limnaea]
MTRFAAALALVVAGAAPGFAQLVTRPVAYQHGPVALEGVTVFETIGPPKRPGVLLAHEQGPNGVAAKGKAAQLVKLGYVVLAADLYGKGVAPKDAADAAARLGLGGKDRVLVRGRVAAGLAALEKLPNVDPKRLAAVGYGAGGTAVLELARAKAEVEGVVCVHGDPTPTGNDGKSVGASVLVVVGADDPAVPAARLAAFEAEMRAGGVDWQVLRMGGVAGDFTNPLAGRDLKTGRAFDPDADARTADAVKLFLAEMFPPPKAAAVAPKAVPKVAPKGVPDKALKVLEHVDRTGDAMDGYEGGRTFGNFERRLPQTDARGGRVRYREWDVNPLRPGVNRGAERLVTGSDGSAFYTADHYDSFTRIR